MAFTRATIYPVSNGAPDLPKLFMYETADNITDVDAADYWAMEPQILSAGDIIKCKCADGFVELGVTSASATASVVAAIGSGGNGGQVWVSAACTGYQTAGAVGYAVAPVAGTILKWKHVTTVVTDTADAILNIDIGGSNATGSLTIDKDDAVGQVEEVDISAGGTVTAGQLIKIESDGGSNSTGSGTVYILIQP